MKFKQDYIFEFTNASTQPLTYSQVVNSCPFIPRFMRCTNFTIHASAGALNDSYCFIADNVRGSREQQIVASFDSLRYNYVEFAQGETRLLKLQNYANKSFNQTFQFFLIDGGVLANMPLPAGGENYQIHIQIEYTDEELSTSEKLLQQMKELMITQTALMKGLNSMTKQRLEMEENELEEELEELDMNHVVDATPAIPAQTIEIPEDVYKGLDNQGIKMTMEKKVI